MSEFADHTQTPERLLPDEMAERLLAFMSDRPGVAMGANTLYQGVFDQPYDASTAGAERDRQYIQLMFIPGHSFYNRFTKKCLENGKAIQVGTMYVDGKNPDDKRTQRRKYRMFDASDYVPSLHESTEFYHSFYIEWRPAAIDIEYVPREITEKSVVEGVRKTWDQRKRQKQVVERVATKQVATKKAEKKYEWEDDFAQAVRDIIIQKDEENLMIPGEVPASAIRKQTTSTIIGTATNRERLFKAGLINRSKTDLNAPLTPEQLVLAELINPKQNILAQKTPAQKAAIKIVSTEVRAHFDQMLDN